MLSLLFSHSLQAVPAIRASGLQISELLEMVHMACSYKFPKDDTQQQKMKAVLDMYPPSKKIYEIIPNYDQVLPIISMYTQLDKSLFDIVKPMIPGITVKALKEMYEPLVAPITKLWVSGDFRKGFNTMIEKSVMKGLEEIGYNLTGFRRLVKFATDVVGQTKDSTLEQVCRTFFHFDYPSFYNRLYDQIVKEGNCNFRIVSDAVVNGLKGMAGIPFVLISNIAETVHGFLDPIVAMFADPNLLKHFKEAAESITFPGMENYTKFLMKASEGVIDYSLINGNVQNPLSNLSAKFKMLSQPGGFKLFLKSVLSETQLESVMQILDLYSGKQFSPEVVAQLQTTFSVQKMDELYEAVKYNANKDTILFPGGKKIDLDQKLIKYIDDLKIPSVTGKQIIDDFKVIIDCVGYFLDITNASVPPLHDLYALPGSTFKNFYEAASKKDETVGSFFDDVFAHGRKQLEFYNSCQNAKVSEIPTDFSDFPYIYTNFYKKANVSFETIPPSFNEFVLQAMQKLGPNLPNLANYYYTSVKGSFYEGEFFDTLRNFTKENPTLNYESLMDLVSGFGKFLLVNNTFEGVKKAVNAIVVPIASEDGKFGDLAKVVLKCDFVQIANDAFDLIDVMLGDNPTKISDLNQTLSRFHSMTEEAARVEEEYQQETGNLFPKDSSSLPAWAIAMICVGAVVVVGAVVAAILIIKRRSSNKNKFAQL